MRNYVQRGDTLTMPAPYDLSSGDGALVGVVFGVASGDAEATAEVELATVGVYTLPKAAGAVTQGAALYWDNTAKVVTTTSTSNTRIGVCIVPAASGDATATVRLNGSF
jgi:predicted RecA/RadA family phage recombinase